MRRKITVALFALIAAAFLIVLVGCEQKENPDNDAPLLQFDGATVSEDNKIEISVGKDVKSVKLTDKVKVKDGYTWKLYADELGTTEISTKIAANVLTSELLDGDNDFYIVVNSDDGKETIVYELTVFRNYEVTVTYKYNGKVVKADIADTNATYSIGVKGDEEFFDDGFVFNGWKDEDGKKVSETIQIEKDDVVLTADLTGKTVAVSLNADGGTLSASKTDVTYGSDVILPVPEREGYRFDGWKTEEKILTDSKGKGYPLTEYKQEITATASWTKLRYWVTTTPSTPYCHTTGDTECCFQDNVTVRAETTIGYVFDGWYLDGVLMSIKLEYSFSMPSKSIELIAEFTAEQYTVYLDAKGGQCDAETTKVAYNSNYTLPVPEKEGYKFDGWYDDKSNVYYTDDNGRSLYVWNITDDKHLSAGFTLKEYIVQVDFDVANYDKETDITWTIIVNDKYFYTKQCAAHFGDSVTVVAQASDSALNCLGWFDGEVWVSRQTSYEFDMPNANVSLQARWTGYKATQRELLNGVVQSETTSYKRVGNTLTLEATHPTAEDTRDTIKRYVWLGWYKNDELLTMDYNCQYLMRNEDVVLSCKFVTLTITKSSDSFSLELLGADTLATPKRGQSVTIRTTSQGDASAFVGWLDEEGNKLSADTTYAFTLTDKKIDLHPVWNISYFTVRSNNENVKKIEINSSACSVDANKHEFVVGTDLTVYFDKDSNLKTNDLVLGWFINDVNVSAQSTYSFKMPSEPFDLYINAVPCPVTVVSDAPDSILFGDFALPHYVGDIVAIEASDVSGYRFKTWLKNGEHCYDHPVLYFTLTTEEVTYTAKYDEIPVELDDFDFAITDDGYSVTGLHNTSVTQIVIPDIVTEIADNAFAEMSLTITELTLPAQLKRIGAQAFRDTFNLKTVRYNGSLADWCKIEFGQNQSTLYRADKFYVNGELLGAELTIPEGVSKINPYAFYGFKPLTKITLPSTMLEVGEYAFRACVNVGEITLNDGLQKIGNSAFSLCHKTTRITIPSSVTDLNVYAFMGCRRLAEICDKTEGKLSNALLNVEPLRIYSEGNSYVATDENGYVFFDDPTQETCALIAYAGNQTDITLPTSINGKQYSVRRYAFEQCDIVSVTITGGVTEICENAFFACRNLSTVTIGGVQSIGKNAFDSCDCLTNFTFSGSPNLGDNVFNGCRQLNEIRYDGSTTEWEQLTKSEQWKGYNEIEKVTCNNGVITLTVQ